MPAAVTPRNFLSLLNQSGLVDKTVLRESLAQLSRQAAGSPVSLEQLMTHLVDSGLITRWHCEKLKLGKYRGFFLGKYKLLGHLGTGGMSTVYLAQHTIFDQQRAIKVLPKNRLSSKTYLERFYREGRAAASLNHRNIVRVYDIGNEADTHYLVMEFVDGQDIYEMVKEHGPLKIAQAVDYIIQALTGLSHAHENQLVHRDVKPANLLVTTDNTVKILDLGLALFREEDTSLTVMHNEKVLGTADYLSPEQAVDSHKVDRRADIYSAGCTLYYMLTGRPPFHEGTLAQRIARHQTVDPEPLRNLRPDCPPLLEAIVKKMMAKNPNDRFESCEPLVAELRNLAEHLPRTADSGTPAEPASRRSAAPSGEKPAQVSTNTERTKNKPVNAQRLPSAGVASSRRGAAPDAAAPLPGDSQQPPARAPRSTSEADGKDRRKATPENSTVAPKSNRVTAPEGVGQNPTDVTRRTKNTASDRQQGGNAGREPKKQPVSVGRKPHVDPGNVSIAGNAESDSQIVNTADKALSAFVERYQASGKSTGKIQRRSTKDQWIMAGMVLGMLALLGGVLALAMWLSAPDTKKSDEDARANPPYTVVTDRQA